MSERIIVRTTRRCELVDITDQVLKFCHKQNVKDGAVLVFSPHTTAGITLNENWDPTVSSDMLRTLSDLVPVNPAFRHAEGNSDAHIKTLLTGSSSLVPVHDGEPLLGTWQGIYLAEFDGPRTRTIILQILQCAY